MFTSTNKEVNLRPCPFCGSNPRITAPFGFLVIQCVTSGCIQPSTYLGGINTTNLAIVAKRWNRRPTDTK